MTLAKLDLSALYEKARVSFAECAAEQEVLIVEETGESIGSIVLKDEWVKVQFSGRDKKHYTTETRLAIHSRSGDRIGYYCHHEDEAGGYIDQYLVFE